MIWSDVADLMLSRACAACARLGPVVCVECWDRAVDIRRHEVPSADLPPVVVGTRYDGLGRDAVQALKDRGVLAMTDAVGGWLAVAIAALMTSQVPTVLVPIPAHRRSVAARGVDTLHRIGTHAAALLRDGGHTVQLVPALERTVDRGRQVGMTADDRRSAVRATMSVRRGALRHRSCSALIVIDDVVTTGATVSEAVRALRADGFEVEGIAAACGTPRSGQSGEPGLHALHDRVDT